MIKSQVYCFFETHCIWAYMLCESTMLPGMRVVNRHTARH